MLDIITRWTSLPDLHPFLVEMMGLVRARPWWGSRAVGGEIDRGTGED